MRKRPRRRGGRPATGAMPTGCGRAGTGWAGAGAAGARARVGASDASPPVHSSSTGMTTGSVSIRGTAAPPFAWPISSAAGSSSCSDWRSSVAGSLDMYHPLFLFCSNNGRGNEASGIGQPSRAIALEAARTFLSPSWPDLIRPPARCPVISRLRAVGRVKPGHDGEAASVRRLQARSPWRGQRAAGSLSPRPWPCAPWLPRLRRRRHARPTSSRGLPGSAAPRTGPRPRNTGGPCRPPARPTRCTGCAA